MSKTAILINGENSSEVEYRGDANIDMVSVNDISCVKRSDNFNSKDSALSTVTYPGDSDHIYASNMNEEEKLKSMNLEITILKTIVRSQISYIQQQSLLLVTKDKQISALIEENETLKSRLERMDRRVTLQKQKDPEESSLPIAHSTPSATTVSQSHVLASSPLVPAHAPTPSDSAAPKTTIEATVANTPFPARKRKRDDNGSICSAASKRTNRSSSWNGILERDESLSINATVCRINGKSTKRDSSQRRKRKRRLKNGDESKRDHNKDILLTNIQYYTTVGDEESVLELNDVPQVNGCVLEVPCWRTKIFTSCYSMEGTENLSEDVFERRHSRLEIDERRRKRWDVQRIREQRQLEKLRQRERRNNIGDDSEELTSLWPLSEDLEHVEISPMLPVAAFGYPIPNFSDSKPTEFTLPWIGFDKSWNNTTSRVRQNTAKQKERVSQQNMSRCFKCNVGIVSIKEKAECSKCEKTFHPTCTRIEILEKFKKMNAHARSTWICDVCKLDKNSGVSK